MDLGSKILEARQKRGLTQKQIADALWVSVQAVSLWEKNKSVPKGERFSRLCEVLGVTPNYLRGEKTLEESQIREGEDGDETPVLPITKLVYFLVRDFAAIKEEAIFFAKPTRPSLGRCLAVQLDETTEGNGYKSGDILFFDTGIVPHTDDLCIVGITAIDRSRKTEKLGENQFSVPMTMRVLIRKTSAISRESSDAGSDVKVDEPGPKADKPPLILGVMVEHRTFRTVVEPPSDDTEVTFKLSTQKLIK